MSRSGLAAGAALALVLGGLMAASRAALADGLGPGESLEYNHRYQCRDEVIIVARCRDETDAAFCQMVYPDRPNSHGQVREPVEQRGDVVRMLQACGAPAAPPRASAPSVSPAPQANAGAKGPPAATIFNASFCPTVAKLVPLAHEDFKSIDGGPDRSSKDPQYSHLSTLSLPGATCNVTHEAGEPAQFSCIWEPSKDVDDQFDELIDTLAQCTKAKVDTQMLELELADANVISQGVVYHGYILNRFLVLEVNATRPKAGPGRGRGPAPAGDPTAMRARAPVPKR